MNSRQIKRFGAVALLFGGALALLAGWKSVLGQDSREEPRRLTGTWNVTLHFPACSSPCPCPGGVPNIPIHALHSYARDESFLEAGAGSLFRGPGLGRWEQVARNEFTAHFEFFLFKPDGTPRGSEEVTSLNEGISEIHANVKWVRRNKWFRLTDFQSTNLVGCAEYR